MIKLRLFSRKKTTHTLKYTKNHLQTDWVCHSGEQPCVCWQRSRFPSLTRTRECTRMYIHARLRVYTVEGWTETPHITRFFLYHGSVTVTCLSNMTFIVLPDTKWHQVSKSHHIQNPEHLRLKFKSKSISSLKQREFKHLYSTLPLIYKSIYGKPMGPE